MASIVFGGREPLLEFPKERSEHCRVGPLAEPNPFRWTRALQLDQAVEALIGIEPRLEQIRIGVRGSELPKRRDHINPTRWPGEPHIGD